MAIHPSLHPVRHVGGRGGVAVRGPLIGGCWGVAVGLEVPVAVGRGGSVSVGDVGLRLQGLHVRGRGGVAEGQGRPLHVLRRGGGVPGQGRVGQWPVRGQVRRLRLTGKIVWHL